MSTSPRPACARPGPKKQKKRRPRTDFEAMEQARMGAADLFKQGGVSQAGVSTRVGVSHQTVSDWHDAWEQGGKDALRAAGRAGRLPRISGAPLIFGQ
ncbi:MAG TPA: helix-turn-helix domain-containing protein [Acidimicrobiales bacterium]|nr:helix-turn-helix domain-containing protein [Acidimicrobiales bacterium]